MWQEQWKPDLIHVLDPSTESVFFSGLQSIQEQDTIQYKDNQMLEVPSVRFTEIHRLRKNSPTQTVHTDACNNSIHGPHHLNSAFFEIPHIAQLVSSHVVGLILVLGSTY